MKMAKAEQKTSKKKTGKDKKKETCSRTARENKMIKDEIYRLTKIIEKTDGDLKSTKSDANKTADSFPDDAEIVRRSNLQLANRNKVFFETLDGFTKNDDGTFKLKRLNNEIKDRIRFPYAVPVRSYAKKVNELYGFEKGSFWSRLSTKDKEFSNKETITREEVIALALVFRLSSDDLNDLLDSLGYYGLYPRQIVDAALIFVLDTYQSSDEFKRFKDPDIDIKKEEFVSNYAFFYHLVKKQSKIDLSLLQSDYIKDFRKRLTTITRNGKPQPSLDTNKWFISIDMLREFIESSTAKEKNQTIQCQTKLRDTISKVIENGQYGNETCFTEFLNSGSEDDESNRERFVNNREKSHRYVLKMLYRYLLRESSQAYNRGIKDNGGIKVSQFFLRFTEFLDYMNTEKASELFIREYVFLDDDQVRENIKKFCVDFFHKELRCYSVEEQRMIRKILRLYLIYCLNIKVGDNNTEKNESEKKAVKESLVDPTRDPVVLSELEIATMKRILQSDNDNDDDNKITPNHYAGFRKILLAEADISRLMFILLYLFTFSHKETTVFKFTNEIVINNKNVKRSQPDANESKTDGISYYSSSGGDISELNRWLLDSGFPALSSVEFLYSIVKKYMDGYKNSYESKEYLIGMFKYILLRDKSLQILSKLHMSSYSLLTMEKILLPKDLAGETNGKQIQ